MQTEPMCEANIAPKQNKRLLRENLFYEQNIRLQRQYTYVFGCRF